MRRSKTLQLFVVNFYFTFDMIKIYEFMERAGFRNQTEFAKKLGLTQSTISAWNAGIRFPTYETCIELLKMGMTVNELFGDDIFVQNVQNQNDVEFDSKVKKSLIRILQNNPS